jgi:hypothetical protein
MIQKVLKVYIQKLLERGDGGDGFSPYDIRPGDSSIRTPDQYNPYAYRQAMRNSGFGIQSGPNADSHIMIHKQVLNS